MASASFENLVARRGSPSYSVRSASTNASTSNVSETRDISRQSQQQARIDHRKAIQARKVAFLVVVLLLLAGGLSYAVYKVVSSNESDENDSTKVRLEQDKLSSSKAMTKSLVSVMPDNSASVVSNSGDSQGTMNDPHMTQSLASPERTHLPLMSSPISSYSDLAPNHHHTSGTIPRKAPQSTVPAHSVPSSHWGNDESSANLQYTATVQHPSILTTAGDVIAHVNTQSTPQLSVGENTEINSLKRVSKSTTLGTPTIRTPLISRENQPSTGSLDVLDSTDALRKQATTVINYPQNSMNTLHHSSSIIHTPPTSNSSLKPVSMHDDGYASQSITHEKFAHKTSTPQRSPTTLAGNPPIATTEEKLPSTVEGDNASPTVSTVVSTNTLVMHTKVSTFALNNTVVPTETLVSNIEASFTHTGASEVRTQASIDNTNGSVLRAKVSVTAIKTLATATQGFIPMVSANISSANLLHNSLSAQSYPSLTHESAIHHSVTESVLLNSSKYDQEGAIWSKTTTSSSIRKTTSSTVGRIHSKHHSTAPVLNTAMIVSHTAVNNENQSVAIHSTHAHVNGAITPTKSSNMSPLTSSVWVAPYYFSWGNWTECSMSCGGGYKYRTRNCSQDEKCGGLGPNRNESVCNKEKCNETRFGVRLNMTSLQWTDDFLNTSSAAYTEVEDSLTKQMKTLYGQNVSFNIDTISQGSVIVAFTITLPATKMIKKFTDALHHGRLGNLSVSIIKIINNMVPGEPESFVVQNTTTNSTTFYWKALHPRATNGILLGYKLLINPGNLAFDTENPDQTFFKVANLMPDTSYTAQLLGYNINGDGITRTVGFKTKDLPPHYLPWSKWSSCSRSCGGGVTTRTRNCSREGLCDRLGEAEQREHCNVFKCNQTSYKVRLNLTNAEWNDDYSNTSSPAYKEMIARLIAELQKKYPNATIKFPAITKGSVMLRFEIIFPVDSKNNAKTLNQKLSSEGVGDYSAEVVALEETSLPRLPPRSINVTKISHHSAMLAWFPISEEDSNGAILGYIIVLSHSNNQTAQFNVSAKASDTEFKYDLRMLTANTTYHFHVYGYNINGKGVDSSIKNFTTRVQIPKITSANVTHVTTIRAILHWSSIPDDEATYGIISGYKINITGHHEHQGIQVPGNETTRLDLARLLPNTTYNVTVLGFNHYGKGVVSEILTFTTRALIPKPKIDGIVNVTSNTATVRWRRVASNEKMYGRIYGYKIIIIKGGTSYNITVTSNTSHLVLRNLSPNNTYSVKVLGYNDFGDGRISDEYQFRTKEDEPKRTVETTTSVFLPQTSSVSPTTSTSENLHNLTPSLIEPPMMSTSKTTYTSSMTTTSVPSPKASHENTPGLSSTPGVHHMTTANHKSANESMTSSPAIHHVSIQSSHLIILSTTKKFQHTEIYSLDVSSFSYHHSSIPLADSVPENFSTVFVHSTEQSSPSEQQVPTAQSSQTSPQSTEYMYILGQIRLTSDEYTDALNEPSSDAFKAKAREVKLSLSSLFNQDGLELVNVTVTGFIKGSVIVSFYVTTLKELNYGPDNVTTVLLEATRNGGLDNKPFEVDPSQFTVETTQPTMKPTLANEADRGLQKNDDGDDNALVIAIVICVLLSLGALVVLLYVGRKRGWFKRKRRKVVPDDDDEDDDKLSHSNNERMRLKTARGPRRSRGPRINGGASTTDC